MAEQELINGLGWLIRMRWFAGAAVLAATAITVRLVGLPPHVALVNPPRFRDPVFIAEVLVFFTCASYVMACLAMAISRPLRRREAEIAGHGALEWRRS